MVASGGCRWGRADRLLESNDPVAHRGEVELACQLVEHRALTSCCSDVVLLEQHHRFCPRLAITVLEILQDLLNYKVVDLGQLVDGAHWTRETHSISNPRKRGGPLRPT